MTQMSRQFVRLAVWSCVTAGLLAAQDPDDGPGRGVARVSLLNGEVSIKRGDSGDLIAAALNAPLVVQDRVLTGINARAEVQFDWANMIRMSEQAEIRLAELEHLRYIVQVARGTVTFRVLRDIEADVELSTPSVAVRPVKKGIYRITVFEDGNSEITVRSGEVEIYTPRGSERLRAGRTMLARGSAADPEYRIGEELREDEWDRWNVRRDRDLERSTSYRYLSRDIYGAEDLDSHGQWVSTIDYGWVWTPRVAVGWAPYRYGRWAWMDWYGWNWVSHDPWGWAPYHYGRWFYRAPYGWCWYPGSIHNRHYWSPALVAFVGFGRGVGVGVGLGGWGRVGWIPLAPQERLHRWWGSRYYSDYRDSRYIDRSVNIVQNVNIRNIYRNARVDNSITGVDSDGFRRGRQGSFIRANDDDFTRASLVQGRLPLAPERDSLRLTGREATMSPVRSADRFYSRRAPASVDRVPFDEQRRGMEQVARRTFGEDAPGRGISSEAGRNGGELPRGLRPSESAGTAPAQQGGDREPRGWRRLGEVPAGIRPPDPSSGTDRGSRGGVADGSEWRRFGAPRIEDGTPAVGGGLQRGERGDRGGRFGEPPSQAGGDAAVSGRREDQGRREGAAEWRRFGGPSDEAGGSSSAGEVAPNRSDRRTGRSDTWRRNMGDGGGPGAESPRRDNQRMEPSRSERFESGRANRGGEGRAERQGGEPVRISPPIVRDRGDRGSGGGDRGAQRSEPSGRMDPGIRSGGGGGDRGARSGGGRANR